MQRHAASHNQTRGCAGEFEHFLWRRHRQLGSLHHFVPELLTTDGHVVRRMITEKGQVVFQEFVDERTATTIVESVESNTRQNAGMLGYSMFSGSEALAIMHTAAGTEPGWLAYPYDEEAGRPSSIPTLPLSVTQIPQLRLVGGATLTWRSCQLVLEAAIEQRADAETSPDFDLLAQLVDWNLATTVVKNGVAQSVRLAARKQPQTQIGRPKPGRVEASFTLDTDMYRQLGSERGLTAWFELEFDRGLFCLPSDWCRWWFGVPFPRDIAK